MGKKKQVRKTPSRPGKTTYRENPNNDSVQTNVVSATPGAEDLASLAFRFLDLPQELRNEIYEYDLQNCDRVRLVKKGRLVSNSALHRVCRQLDDELAALLRNTARASRGKLYYAVQDFEFTPAMISALQWLVSDTKATTLTVRLSISKSWSSFPALDSLPKWYKWIDANSKRDDALDIKYTIGTVQDAARAESFLSGLTGSIKPPHALLRMVWSFLVWYRDNVYQRTDFRPGVYTFEEKMHGIKRDLERAGVIEEDRTPSVPQKTLQEMVEEERKLAMKYRVEDVGMMGMLQ